ncbi:polysaccharide deacetylase family protein [Algoriphagus halophytocola]|uniref:Polysaccharide deacetylase family protein n=1 Tax=Algoriphagus halophytocola TaxID=2991499 RepID=A0ABY6MG91_9BACT|nr:MULTISPECIES: polysaccharide deacetylase family protein [unclassified Algoriphagus]UZD21646.1 polysaccharide deacetylase family protein [Algoriphagus sp. TR-M5]WBL42858.1 polysaccharide deacetylase family protein [Algoriphagus sp. TR-M9]
MKRLFTLTLLLAFSAASSIAQNLAEKLGYPADTKLLIIHGDDVGVSHSQTKATFDAMKNGVVNSTSMMVPTGWSAEVGEMAKELPNADIGIHITLTNEWLNFNWGPEAGKTAVPGLANAKGHMYPDCGQVAANASPEEVEREIRAQIKAANQMGIIPTHLDSHMGCIFYGRPEYLASYLRIAQELQIPAMINQMMIDNLVKPNAQLFSGINVDNFPVVDQLFMAEPQDYQAGMEAYYTKALTNLTAGLNVILIHLAFDDEEMNAVTKDHDTYHAPWRQEDYDFFTSEKAKNLLKQNKVQLVTWREVGKTM